MLRLMNEFDINLSRNALSDKSRLSRNSIGGCRNVTQGFNELMAFIFFVKRMKFSVISSAFLYKNSVHGFFFDV